MKNHLSDKTCALITGASSGLGTEFAKQLHAMGFEVILTGRNKDALAELSGELGNARYIVCDLARTKSVLNLYTRVKDSGVDLLINCAGFGIYDRFDESSLNKEIDMINVNVRAVHILFKLFLQDFKRQGRGYILNVGSIAGFLPGPMMSGYYASKAYVIRMTEAVWAEQVLSKSPVKVGVLCPGPVQTDFNKHAGISGFYKGLTAEKCVSDCIKGMEKGMPVIVPSVSAKLVTVGAKLCPALIASLFCYIAQKGKKRL